MHSCVTTNPPCAVRMTAPDTTAAVADAARIAPPVIAIQPATTSTNALS